ncbi:DUF481 domain-containing protein [Parvularcula lutaonensis]|uniref:YdiY family protein n=1 Tax=Parvularcula lutaonensis TaxID=491923 RepID=A0ABV7MGH0_9PROT|nr:DUF481 domain-containing protein [Parvularcula lutaonensis]GGY52163.1 hypothetical protein GCM10007148_21550 [Parvularcula lutaonensis]
MTGLLILAAASASASSLFQPTEIKAEENRWSGSVVFNLSSATGNTENTVIGGRFQIARKYKVLTHAFDAGGNYTETTTTDAMGMDVTDVTQNNWFAQYRMEIQTGDRTFVYGKTRYEEDQFSGFDRKAFVGGGLGHTFVKTDTRELQMLIGPGVQYFEREVPSPEPANFERTETSAAVFFGQTFKQVIKENVTFEQSFDATVADENTTAILNVAVKSNLTDKISLRTSYNIKHETDPPQARKQTDTLLSVSIGYDF